MWHHFQQQQAQQQKTNFQQSNHQNYVKKTDDDEDTLSLDSEKSQGYINEPVNNWPSWSVGSNNPPQIVRSPVTFSPPEVFQPQQATEQNYYQQSVLDTRNNPNYANSQIPNYDTFNRGPVMRRTGNVPQYFSRSPVYFPPPNYQQTAQQNLIQAPQNNKPRKY